MFKRPCTSIADAYVKGVDYILHYGVLRLIHGTTVLQADPCTLDIRIDNNDDYCDRAPLKEFASEVYMNEFLNPSKGDHPYTYGERLVAYPCEEGPVSQVEVIARKVFNEPYTRQATGVIWHPGIDNELDDPPCFQFLQAYMNTKDELSFVFLFRSNDWYQALMNNLQGLKVLANAIAGMANQKAVNISLIAVCPHIYWYNLDEVCRKWDYSKENLPQM